ncbi:alpha/beta hydrolase [Dissulfurimicrobium hydrothermale]|uniref:alpha/beta hydrolase n=1 Tax=Dissulfurimicrobium hydrothermale TaxID=1750598 RepID=UPI001EDC1573|nr:alpha/beta fold hydrolase [Dissulfurimicrobium hydrothermale]UKL13119.1 alpha/beta fold hydrolase [Dissulfurimicrobium hydrothermale]
MSDHKIEIDMKGGDDAVLLIHGLTGSPFEMKYLARRLNRAGFTVKGPCLAGHGKTLSDLKKSRWQDWYRTVADEFRELKEQYATVSVAGLCMGALLALFLSAEFKREVAAIALLSTTLFYDGWGLPWYKFLLPLAYYTPAGYIYSFEEREPYGIKNKALRVRIVELMKDSSIAHSSVPGVSMRELFKLINTTKKLIPQVKTPTLILHSQEDDLASKKNALYVQKNIGARDVRMVLLDDCYHMLPIDNQRDVVADEIITFFKDRTALRRKSFRDTRIISTKNLASSNLR